MPRDTDGYGKTDDPRPRQVSDEVWGLRYELATKRVSPKRRQEIYKRLRELEEKRS